MIRKLRSKKGIVTEIAIMCGLVTLLVSAAVAQKQMFGGPKPTKAAMRKCAGEGTIKDPVFKAKVDVCRELVAKMDYAQAKAYIK